VSANGFTARSQDAFEISGEMTFQSVPQFLLHTDEWLKSNASKITIDLAGVTHADSAGLALLIEWLQRARAAQRAIVFTHMPDQMRELARVNGLEQVLPPD
jgi:phospholipid transport system transporter-binding protein